MAHQHSDPLPTYVYLPISQEEIMQATASIGLHDGSQNTQNELDQLLAIAAMVANERRNQTEIAWNERLDQELETMSCANSEVSVEQTQIENELAQLVSGSSKQKKKVREHSQTLAWGRREVPEVCKIFDLRKSFWKG